MDQIRYYDGYKYQLAEDYSVLTAVTPAAEISARFIKLAKNGTLTIRADYAWDGPSGPTIDTPDSMRGSLVHDALYQLIRLGLLPATAREAADGELLRLLREDGMDEVRARGWHRAVRTFGGPAAEPADTIHVAPIPRPIEHAWPHGAP